MTKPDPNEVIWRDGPAKLSISPFASDAWLDYVSTVWFGPTGKQYQRRTLRDQIRRFEWPHYLSLTYAGKLVGSYLVDRQNLNMNGTPVLGFYRGLLTIDETFRAQGLGARMVDATLSWIDGQAAAQAQPVMTYGCIDAENTRSIKLLEARGMRLLGTLSHCLIYRQFVRRSLSRHQVTDQISDAAREHLDSLTNGAELTFGDHSHTHWAGLTNNANIGCRFALNELCLAPMDGLSGFFVEKLVPLFPPARRRFDPRRFRYVTITDAIFEPGMEAAWSTLIEHLLKQHECHFAVVTLNDDIERHRLMLKSGVLGKQAMTRASKLRIMGRGDQQALPPDITIRLAARDL
ncbi:MAG: GNAT family N-acetyltransferase [Woeseiaceae bacterium]